MAELDQCTLITGATGGIGAATARRVAAAGYRVFGTSRSPRGDVAGVEMLELDVRAGGSVERCVAEVLERAGRIDVLVNNAGVWHVGIAEETPLADARTVFDTDFWGAVRVIAAVLPGMRERRSGRIINIGSLGAWVGEPGEAFYAASKRALATYTEALRHEVWPFGVHVSLVEPGAFATGLQQVEPSRDAAIEDYDAVRGAVRRTLRRALRGGGDPDRVARVVLRVARARRPRLRYAVGRERWLPYLRMLLPQRWFDYLVRHGFGLTKLGR
jgi:NAD(P)-dependent dehydrogenase (short-subunit alcohol dehydrogenase family)